MDLKTGDLLLFNSHSSSFFSFSSLIKWGTHSNYTHVAMILKDPSFIHPCLKGTFVWESSWQGTPDPQDGKVKLGVQITPLKEMIDSYGAQNVFVRKIECDESLFSPELETSPVISSIFISSFGLSNSLSIKEVSSFNLSDILFIIALTNTLSGKRSSLPSSIAFNCCTLIFKSVANSFTD